MKQVMKALSARGTNASRLSSNEAKRHK